MTLNRRDLLTGTVATVATTGAAVTTEAEAPAQREAPPGLDPDLDTQLFGSIERLADRLQSMRVYWKRRVAIPDPPRTDAGAASGICGLFAARLNTPAPF